MLLEKMIREKDLLRLSRISHKCGLKLTARVFASVLLFFLCATPLSAFPEFMQEGLQLPRFGKKSLLNGMQFLFFQGTPQRVPFVLMIKNGAAFDPIGKWGVTELTVRTMMESTERVGGDQIRQALLQMEAELSFRVEWDAIFFRGEAPREHLVEVLGLLSDIVIHPDFNDSIFTREREELVKEVLGDQRDVEVESQERFRSGVFGENPYGHGVKGTAETLAGLFRRDLILQYRKLFMPNQAVLAIGHEDESGLFSLLSRKWGTWVKGQAAPFTFRQAEPPGQTRILLLNRPVAESIFRWGLLSTERSSRNYFVWKVFEQYLTLFLTDWAQAVSDSSQIRAAAQLQTGRMTGYFQLSIVVAPDDLANYYNHFQSWLTAALEGQIDEQRLEEARNLVLQDLIASLESPFPALEQVLRVDLYEIGINYLATAHIRLSRVTKDRFVRVLREELEGQKSTLIVVGPAAQLEPVLKALAPVQVLN